MCGRNPSWLSIWWRRLCTRVTRSRRESVSFWLASPIKLNKRLCLKKAAALLPLLYTQLMVLNQLLRSKAMTSPTNVSTPFSLKNSACVQCPTGTQTPLKTLSVRKFNGVSSTVALTLAPKNVLKLSKTWCEAKSSAWSRSVRMCARV